MSSNSTSLRLPSRPASLHRRAVPGVAGVRRGHPEILGVAGVAAILNLWGLGINGWANTYYAAAVRSMTTSWHDFLFASLDRTGLMTVDKPPLSLWVQALSARIFGFHPLSLLVPQALMGVAAAVLVYDLTRRVFGRAAGFAAGVALATTPMTVAISRHNNPDQLLILCCVAALWLAVRALQDGRTRWLVLSGICVGLGFETKMAVALFVVPGIALAYLWVAPSRLRALRQLLAGAVAMAVVGLAWPLLVTLTPAADRPWISGTADNSIWSLIFSYNGVGRVTGQTGAPGAAFGGGGGGGPFGGATGVFRLLQSGLGDQAGWLLGFAIAAGLVVLALSRLRRRDPRTGWLIAVGGAFVVSAVVFSFAQGIFHPYYISFLAPFSAALIGAGVGEILGGGRTARVAAPVIIGAGLVTELIVLDRLDGELAWATPLVIVAGVGCAVALAWRLPRGLRPALVAVALAALLAAPATYAAQTLGHATSSTFPTGGPASNEMGGLGGHGGFGRGGFGPGGFARAFGGPGGAGSAAGGSAGQGGFAAPGGSTGASAGQLPPGAASLPAAVQSMLGSAGSGSGAGAASGGFPGFGGRSFPGGGFPGFGGGAGGMFGGNSAELTAAVSYADAHGGGTIGVESQSSAASWILASSGRTPANVAGLGGFSGRESSVTAAWLATEVRDGRLRWILADTGSGAGLPGMGDNRQGSTAALSIAEKVGRKVTFTSGGTQITLYDLQGRAAAILDAAAGAG